MSERKTVAVFGASGFVGRGLLAVLAQRGCSTVAYSRSEEPVSGADETRTLNRIDLSGCHAVVNLAGEPVSQRWTADVRRRIRESRVGLTEHIVSAIAQLPVGQRPGCLVNASAVGIYGHRGEEVLSEESPPGTGVLSDLVRDWEAAARQAEGHGVRVVCLRIGIVLGRDGGALAAMLPAFRLGLGGKLGNGEQWMPWIHVEDLRRVICHALENESLSGPVNAASPHPVRNSNFTAQLAAALGRPAFFRVPGFALKLVLGGFGRALLESQRVLPGKLGAGGFGFRHAELGDALGGLLGPEKTR